MKMQFKLSSKLALVVALIAALLVAPIIAEPAFAENDANSIEVIDTELLQDISIAGASEGRILFYDMSGNYGYLDYEGNVVIPAQFDYASAFNSGVAEVSTDKGQAYIDLDGEIVFYADDVFNKFDSEGSYPEIYAFSNGYARVNTYESTGYINNKGEFVVPMNVYYNGYDFGDGLVQVFEDSYETYFIREDGTKAFDANPDLSYSAFSGGRAVVYDYNNGQYGYVDETGEIVISTTLDDAYDFVGDLAIYKELGKYGVINRDGKFLLLPTFKDAKVTEEGYVIGYDGVFTMILDSQMNPINRFVGDQMYNSFDNIIITPNSEGYVYKDFEGNELGVFDDYYYMGNNIFDTAYGQIVITDGVVSEAMDNPFNVKADYEYKFLNNKGEVAIDLSEYDSVSPFSEGRALVEKNGKFGYIDTEGNVVIPIKYIDASDFYDGEASVETVTDYLTIDLNGKTVYSEYDYIEEDSDSEFYVISTGYYGDSGVANRKTNKIVLDTIYSSVTDAGNGFFEVMNDSYQYGYYNANTDTLVEPAYEYLTIYSNEGRVVVQTSDYNYGMYDLEGNVILEPVYDYISVTDDKIYEIQKDYYYGIATSEGEVIIKPEFDYIYSDYAKENIVVFSTEKGNESHVLVYDVAENKVLTDELDGTVLGAGETFLVLSDYNGNITVAKYTGEKLLEAEGSFLDSSGKYIHLEDYSGMDYLMDDAGNKYLYGNDFIDIYMPVEDNHIIFQTEGGYGIVSVDGEIKTKKIYESVSYIDAGIMATYDDEKFGYVNVEGEDIVEPGHYEYLYNFSDGLGLVIKAND